jgi:hypothetical protein
MATLEQPATNGHEQTRRFRLINASLPKTGSTSIAGLFSRNFRAVHEFLIDEAAAVIYDYCRGHLDAAALRRFVLDRDAAGGLEVDSATFNHWYAEILVAQYADARFLLLFREPSAWVESGFGQAWHESRQAHSEGRAVHLWTFYFGKLMAGPDFDIALLESVEALRPALPAMVEHGLRFWRRSHERLLEILPPERRLLVDTAELSSCLPQLAAFAGVAVADLDQSSDHLRQREESDALLSSLDPVWFANVVERECGETWQKLKCLARQHADR